MYNFNIKKITTKSGVEIVPKRINVIIGPNNTGKSTFIKEIYKFLSCTQCDYKIIDNIEYSFPLNINEFIKRYNIDSRIYWHYNSYYLKNYSGYRNIVLNNEENIQSPNFNSHINVGWENDIKYDINNMSTQFFSYKDNALIRNFGLSFLSYIGAEEKLFSIKSQETFGLNSDRTSIFDEIKFNNEINDKLSEHTKKLFNTDIILDTYTMGNKTGFRVSKSFSFFRNKTKRDVSNNKNLINYPLLDEQGDGIKSFVSTFLTLKLPYKNIILLDEAEAFLYPTHQKLVGEIVSKEVNKFKQLFIVTHSGEFLQGIVSSLKDTSLSIIKIDRDGSTNNIKLIKGEKLKKLIVDLPMVVASNMLNGLFCKKIYITESYTDTCIYETILKKANPSRDAYFVNCQSKHKIHDVAKFYNSFGIDTVSIYDLDIIRDKKDFDKIIPSSINSSEKKFINDATIIFRSKIKSLAKSTYVVDPRFTVKENEEKLEKHISKYYHNLNVSLFSKKELSDLYKVLNILKNHNVIILKTGCLETTLIDSGLPFTTNKNNWYEQAINKLNSINVKKLDIYKYLYE